jgi:hypothetical protein
MGIGARERLEEEEETLLAKLELIDRRYLYLLILICVIVPLVTGIKVPVAVSRYSQDLYNMVESLPDESYVLYLFGPSFWGESRPMFIAMWKHLLMRPLNVILLCRSAAGFGFWNTEVKPILEEEGLLGGPTGTVYGEDFVNIGFVSGGESMYRSFAKEIRSVVVEDEYGTPLDDIPMMVNITSAYDIAVVVIGEGYAVESAYRQFGPPSAYDCIIINIGMSSCIAKYVPFIEAGEIYEMPGIRGGGEYEKLIDKPWLGITYMSSTTLAHLVLLIFLVLGNSIYFFRRSRGEVQ